MHLLPLPLVKGTLDVPESESPYGYHRSQDSMVACAVVAHASTDSVSLHTVVCMFVHFAADRGSPRLCKASACARGTVPLTVALRVTARPDEPSRTHQPLWAVCPLLLFPWPPWPQPSDQVWFCTSWPFATW